MVGDMVAAEEEEGNRKYRGQCRCVKGQKSELQTWYAKSHLPLGRAAMNKPVHYGQLLTQLQARRVSCLHTMLRPSCPMSQERAAAVWKNGQQNGSMNKTPARGHGKVLGVVNCSVCLPGRIRSPKPWSHSQPCRPGSSVLEAAVTSPLRPVRQGQCRHTAPLCSSP